MRAGSPRSDRGTKGLGLMQSSRLHTGNAGEQRFVFPLVL